VIVEDDAALGEALRRVLAGAGFRVGTYPSAEAFLAAGAETATACLVLDIHLPGLSGLELHRRLAEAGAPVRTVFITARDEDAIRAQAERSGTYLVKPFSGRVLIEAVAAALQQRAS
jgi:FixJ family two-component response regulator